MSNTDGYKANVELRAEVAGDDVEIIGHKRALKMHTKTLRKAEEYYSLVLEALCGKQVWEILDALAAVQEELKSRCRPVDPADFEQVKLQVFADLDRNYKKHYG